MPGRALRRPFFLRPPTARRPANCPLLREVPATEPQNLKTAHPGGAATAVARGPRRLGQGHAEFAIRRSRPAPPPGALLGPAPQPPQSPAPGPPRARDSSPDPPHARGAPRASQNRRPPPRTPRAATRAGPGPLLTSSRRPRARPSRILARVRFTASAPGAVGSDESAEMDRCLGTARR